VSDHWYTTDGTPCHEIECKTKPGKFRPLKMEEVRELGLVPSVTSILGMVNNFGLRFWYRRETLQWFIEQKPRPRRKSKDETDQEYCARMVVESDPHLKRSARLGTRIHNMIERMIRRKSLVEDQELSPFCEKPFEWFEDQRYRDVVVERPFTSVLGYGGQIDVVVGGSDDEPENPAIVDWKSQATEPGNKFKIYPSYGAQLVAYAKGICLDDAQLVNVMISTTEPSRFEVFEWPREQHDALWMAFLQAFALWKGPLGKNYDPTEGSPF
jgi:hypothetical protein